MYKADTWNQLQHTNTREYLKEEEGEDATHGDSNPTEEILRASQRGILGCELEPPKPRYPSLHRSRSPFSLFLFFSLLPSLYFSMLAPAAAATATLRTPQAPKGFFFPLNNSLLFSLIYTQRRGETWWCEWG